MKYSIIITSVDDRSNLVAEIWNGDQMIAEINQENKDLEVEFYSNRDNTPISLNLEALFNALNEGKQELTNTE